MLLFVCATLLDIIMRPAWLQFQRTCDSRITAYTAMASSNNADTQQAADTQVVSIGILGAAAIARKAARAISKANSKVGALDNLVVAHQASDLPHCSLPGQS
jgi:hypothetical protein